MPNKYRVKEDGVKINGTQYNEGDVVELTDEVAAEVGEAVEFDEEATAGHTHHTGDENLKGSEDPGTAEMQNADGESANEPSDAQKAAKDASEGSEEVSGSKENSEEDSEDSDED